VAIMTKMDNHTFFCNSFIGFQFGFGLVFFRST
jgi:hypothetical protein